VEDAADGGSEEGDVFVRTRALLAREKNVRRAEQSSDQQKRERSWRAAGRTVPA